MSKNHSNVSRIVHWIPLLCTLTLPSLAAARSVEKAPLCNNATEVRLNSSLRDYNNNDGTPFLLKLEIPQPGIFSVDVTAPGNFNVKPRLGFAGDECEASDITEHPAVLERSVNHLVILAREAGTHFFRVASRDPQVALHDLKIRTAFVPDGRHPPTKEGEDEDEIEIDPDPIIFPGGGHRSLRADLHELCQRWEEDDHADSLTCATLLTPGARHAGEIRNGWGDDTDVFVFHLGSNSENKLWTVEIESDGEIATAGALYDHSGQRLGNTSEETNTNATEGNFRIVRTLGPGAYYVRVEGRERTEGAYQLRIAASPW